MSWNDRYKELGRYRLEAQNQISDVFENNYAELASDTTLDSEVEYRSRGARPKSNYNAQKVHFRRPRNQTFELSRNFENINSRIHHQIGQCSSRNGRHHLKSCLKNPLRNRQQFINPDMEVNYHPRRALSIGGNGLPQNDMDFNYYQNRRGVRNTNDEYALQYLPNLTINEDYVPNLQQNITGNGNVPGDYVLRYPQERNYHPRRALSIGGNGLPQNDMDFNYFQNIRGVRNTNDEYPLQYLPNLTINEDNVQNLQQNITGNGNVPGDYVLRYPQERASNRNSPDICTFFCPTITDFTPSSPLRNPLMSRNDYKIQDLKKLSLNDIFNQENQAAPFVNNNRDSNENILIFNQENQVVPIVNNNRNSGENILRLIKSIQADIQELKERYKQDDEIERNRSLTQDLDDLLNLYKTSSPSEVQESDILSDVASGTSYNSARSETVVETPEVQSSPSLSFQSVNTNLSKASECASSPCLTISDTDFLDADDSQSISSSDCSYNLPSNRGARSTPQAVWRGKSSSAPVLKNQQPKVNKQARSQSDRHLAEIEAEEACKWLRSTGFPQYAQMFEDNQFPVDESIAIQDHPWMDKDILKALVRRLRILNNCAHLHQQRNVHNTDESEDENCTLSRNWTFQSDIRRWSRACQTEEHFETEVVITTNKAIDSESEDQNESPRDRTRRGGSVKCRRRREGVIISDSGAKLLDSLSEQLSGISVASSLNHASDSELTPKFYNRFWTKPSEKESHINTIDNSIVLSVATVQDGEVNIFYCKFSSQQLGQLEKIAMLKLTAYIEKYCPTHRTGWNWDVPKNLLRKMKNPAYKDKVVFGVPIQLTLQRTGHPLPRNIENALEWLQENAVDQVGLFRKSGVRSRIQTLRNMIESSDEILSFEDQQPYDVADMVKQYFRELPEALLTNKLSETFKLIFQFVPAEFRLEAVLCAIFLMPDEHIEVLQTLISFLKFISSHSMENQMNESNLATCFAPSLFHYSHFSKTNLGTPHPKDLAENQAARDCLLFFLENYDKLFTIPRGLINQCNPVEMKEWKVLNLKDLGKDVGGWLGYLKECEQAHLKEVKDKSRGWTVLPNFQNPKVEVYFKKIDDGLSVRVWKVIADIDAPPAEVLHRILRERHIWDLELISAKIVVQLDKNTEIFQYGRKRITPLPVEEYCVVRHWNTEFPKGACMIVETSVEHEEIVHIPDSIRGIVHASRYYIEPCGSGRSRIYHMCRTDTMGRKPEYYFKNYGHVVGFFISNIQNSFYQQTSGPESKV